MRDFGAVGGPLDFGPFLALPASVRDRLAEAATPLSVAAGDRLVTQGEAPDAAFVLTAGMLRVETDGTVQNLLSAPALVGETALLEGVPRSASVIADGASHVLRLAGVALVEAIASSPDFAEALTNRAAALAAHTFLREDSPFGELPGELIDELAAKLRRVRVPGGTVLFREGDTDTDIYLVRHGTLEVVREIGTQERVLAALGPGTFVGETAALTGRPRSATVRARGAVEAYRLAASDVRPLLQGHAAVVARLTDALTVRHRPKRAPSVSAVPSPDEADAVILRNDADGKYLKVSGDTYALFEAMDGENTLRDLVLRHFERTGEMDPPAVFRTVASLQAAGFASAPGVGGGAAASDLRTRLLDLVLAPRIEVRSADGLARALHRALWPLATGPAVAIALGVGVAGGVVFALRVRGLSLDTFGLGGVVVAWAGLLLAGVGHELAHLLACKRFGSRLGRGGVGLMWFSPLIYVDTTDTWTLDRRRRILVNAAGPMFNFALAGVASLASLFATGTAADLLLWLAGMNLIAVLFNLSPLLEFDGYYVLSDLANTPMLRKKALRFVFRELLERPRLPRSRFEWGLTAFAVACVLYGLVLTAFVMVTVPPGIQAALRQWLAPPLVTPVWALAALGILALTIGPLVDDVMAARNAELSETSAAGSAPS